jgi:hypothetical protein
MIDVCSEVHTKHQIHRVARTWNVECFDAKPVGVCSNHWATLKATTGIQRVKHRVEGRKERFEIGQIIWNEHRAKVTCEEKAEHPRYQATSR